MSAAEWFYATSGQQKGPVALDALRRLVAAGDLGSADLVWCEGMSDWQPARAVPELASHIPTDQTLPPPPAAPYPPRSVPPQYGAAPDVTPPPARPVQGTYGAQPTQPPLPYGQAPTGKSGLATASLVLGILALACNGFIFGILAIILSILASNEMNQSGNSHNRGTATAGLVLGIVGIAKSFGFPFLFHHHHWLFR
jgi:hypothetical protein